jgi:sec-independent protein translocase protein TatA
MIFNELRPWHLLILVVVALALFGYKRLPDATRSVGRSLRIFKSEMKGMHDDEPEKPKGRPEAPAVIEGQSNNAAAESSAQAAQSAQASQASTSTSSGTTPPTTSGS